MSQLTIQVDQFLINVLQPEIDVLNLSLVSMEERGYSNTPIVNTRRKLNKLITIYDFLKEYAYGNEESDDAIIRNIMGLVGAADLSMKSNDPIIQAVRSSLDINSNRESYNAVRIYKNDEIVTSTTITSTDTPTTFKVYASNNVDQIEVIFSATGINPITYTGVNNVVIPNVMLNASDMIVFAVKAYRNGETLVDETLEYNVLYHDCLELSYWVGSVTERFTISDSDLNESSTISIDPNSGSNGAGELITYNWVVNNLLPEEEYMFREEATQVVDIEDGDSHLLIMVPTRLAISDVKELVVGTPVDMTEGLHYDIITFDSQIRNYNCIYFRDLTSLTFPARKIQFNIKSA